MVDISIIDDRVQLRVRGWSRLWALARRVEFTLASIRDVRADPTVARGMWKGIRLPGTHLPGVVIAGTFRTNGQWHFWDVRSGARAIVIDLEGEEFDRVIVEVDDPERAVRLLKDAVAMRAVGRSDTRRSARGSGRR